MLSDLNQTLRQLRKSPGFTVTVVVTLALGIGATTAIFTLIQQVMLKSLPVVNPRQLWLVGCYAHARCGSAAGGHHSCAARRQSRSCGSFAYGVDRFCNRGCDQYAG